MVATERATIRGELTPGHTVTPARGPQTPFVLSSPHSGRVYPRAFVRASRLGERALRKSEDAFVDELFAAGPESGAPLIAARFPRAYLDLNREPFELDPELFRDPLPNYANSRSPRVVGGLGTIARVVAEAEEIYRERMSLRAGLERIEKLYVPYHDALDLLLRRARRQTGLAILLDCHSMPSNVAGLAPGSTPDIILGDRFGCSCDPALTRLAADLLRDLGYGVALNRPYAGGFITEHYGRPAEGFHALQIEINKALYMDEETVARSPGFAALCERITLFLDRVIGLAPGLLQPRAAAE